MDENILLARQLYERLKPLCTHSKKDLLYDNWKPALDAWDVAEYRYVVKNKLPTQRVEQDVEVRNIRFECRCCGTILWPDMSVYDEKSYARFREHWQNTI